MILSGKQLGDPLAVSPYGSNRGGLDSDPGDISRLKYALTLNGRTVLPEFRYKGELARNPTVPAWRFGDPLTLQAGAPTFNTGSDLYYDSFTPDGVSWYRDDVSTSSGNIGTDDFVFEIVYRHATGSQVVASKWTGAGAGWAMQIMPSGTVRFWINDGTGNAFAESAVLTSGTWYHLIYVGDRNGTANSQIYAQGAASGAAVSLGGRPGSLDSANRLALNSYSNGSSPSTSAVAYCALWRSSSWLQDGAPGLAETAAMAANRYGRIT